ncbi:MAG: cell division protein FtsZ, partial [Sphingobacteriales bacterium]
MTSFKFDLPTHSQSIIKVIGVGGGGSNAVNHMYSQGIKDVEFVICNTDKQALHSSPVPNKLQIGSHLTEGLGAGANPERGKQAALESKEEIREALGHDTKMVFITAGMGGGTGTGAAPVIAKIAKEMDILTVGIVTAPFVFEGKKKRQQAENGIKELSENCDTILVILNDKLREMFGNLPIRQAFAKADNVLSTAAKSIAEIITVTADVNVDFEDVKTVMKNSGAAVMGSAITEGENRAERAAEEALNSPLLNNTDILGAQKILLSIMSGEQAELEMDELTEITDYIQMQAGDDADVIFGHGIDTTLGQSIRVTVIATGFAKGTTPIATIKKVIDLDSQKMINIVEAGAHVAPEVSPEPVFKPYTAPAAQAPSLPFAQTPPPAPTPQPEPQQYTNNNNNTPAEPPRVVFNLGSSADAFTASNSRPEPAPQQQPVAAQRLEEQLERERQLLALKAQERRDRLRKLSTDNSQDSYKEKLEVPAYLRKNVPLDTVAHSSERSISRYKLTARNAALRRVC